MEAGRETAGSEPKRAPPGLRLGRGLGPRRSETPTSVLQLRVIKGPGRPPWSDAGHCPHSCPPPTYLFGHNWKALNIGFNKKFLLKRQSSLFPC